MKNTLGLLMVFSIFFSCKTYNKSEVVNSQDFEVIYQSEYGGDDQNAFLAVESLEDWKTAFKNKIVDEALENRIRSIDFNNQMVVVLHAGQKSTGGYAITVDHAEAKGSTTTVVVKETSPKAGEQVTMAISNPFCVAIIPKNKKVSFSGP